ncbi:MAG: WD40 repeat domain-containing protein [Anaerolineae bacterium]
MMPIKWLFRICIPLTLALLLVSVAVTTVTARKVNWTSSVAWSSNDQIAIGTLDGTIEIFNEQRQIVQTFQMGARVYTLAFSPDGSKIAVGGGSPSIKIWNMDTGQLDISLVAKAEIWGLGWSPDGNYIAGVEGPEGTGTSIWNVDSGTIIASDAPGSYSVDWSPDGNKIVIGTYNDTRILDANTLQTLQTIPMPLAVKYATWSPDGTKIATAQFYTSQSVKISILDVFTGHELHEFLGHTDVIGIVLWSPDGTTLASGSTDGTIRIWNANSGQLINTIQTDTRVLSLAWSPDGKQIAYGEPDGILRVIDLNPISVPTPQ